MARESSSNVQHTEVETKAGTQVKDHSAEGNCCSVGLCIKATTANMEAENTRDAIKHY